MAHGIGSAAVDNVGECLSRIKINVLHRYKHKLYRTAVGLARPSTSFLSARGKDVVGRHEAGHDDDDPSSPGVLR